MPVTAAELQRLMATATELENHLQRLGGAGMPPEVLAFHELAQSGRADLSTVTSDILDWLRLHGLLGRYGVGVRHG